MINNNPSFINTFNYLPTEGIVKCNSTNNNDYYYLELPQTWHDNANKFVDFIKDNHKPDQNIINKFINKHVQNNHHFKFTKPLAPIGPHITITSSPKIEIGTRVKFQILDIYVVESFDSKSEIYNTAMFSPKQKHVVLEWYLLKVKIDDELKPKFGEPHITLACHMAISNQ